MNMVAPVNKVALIAGPTASGKSAVAMDLARRTGGVIVNADASQVYRDLRVLTARPSATDEARVPHRLYGYRDGAEPCSAAAWAADARALIVELHADGRLPILVGGSGLYLRTLLDGIAPIPEIDPAIRADVRRLPPAEAYAALQREDAVAAAGLHPNDAARTARALEVMRSTGRSIRDWRTARVGGIRGTIALEATIVDPPLAELYARCDARFAAMVDGGALEEVAALLARGLDPALPIRRAIGVAEIAALLRGERSRAETVAAGQQATRNYAKRQRTWFRHQSPRSDMSIT